MTAKQTIFLHAGMHKTASTSIQASLRDVTGGATRYAQLGAANHSIAMLTAFAARPDKHMYYLKRHIGQDEVSRRRAAFRAQLAAELATPEPNLVISGEELGFLFPPDLADMRAFFAPHCAAIRIIGYIREPVGFAASAFQQIVRHRKVRALRIPPTEYRRRFGMFIDTFGRASVDLIPFDPSAFRDRCVITDFCDRTGIDPAPLDRTQLNTSLSAEVVALFLAWNRGGMASSGSPTHVRAVGRLTAALRKAFPGKFRLDPALVTVAQDDADRAWVERTGGFILPPPDAAGPKVAQAADLAALEERALGPLAALLTARGIPVPEPRSAVAMMDALYSAMFESVRRAG